MQPSLNRNLLRIVKLRPDQETAKITGLTSALKTQKTIILYKK